MTPVVVQDICREISLCGRAECGLFLLASFAGASRFAVGYCCSTAVLLDDELVRERASV